MEPPFPCPTPTWHNDSYSAIDPMKPELSQAGKTVVITGAGSGIGRQTSIAFAKAGAKHVVLIGRTEASLLETQGLLAGETTTSSVFAASVIDQARMQQIAEAVGTWDILILNAGHISTPGPLTSAPLDDYWLNFETNVKSVVIASQAFVPTATALGAAVYAISSGALVLPTKATAYLSTYLSSKVAQVKVMEYLAVENPNLFVCSVHPGMVETKIFSASGTKPEQLPMDAVELPANFLV
ncbi:hypothetical protein BDV96DRAFT_101545 [Lophiotrema nucula]|uniref:NAD(P)-binding protein n=1 Tax=Lophiotrema nucula TaxID=690887 RepID=A0A6A5Z6E8_9PLEO|nr:hypothetical protein BDV96DRAFT_101545 [Lophiotrema nucula]